MALNWQIQSGELETSQDDILYGQKTSVTGEMWPDKTLRKLVE
jgi:hypothetical protein